MSVGQKLAKLKIRSTRVTFLSLHNLEAAPEETKKCDGFGRIFNIANF